MADSLLVYFARMGSCVKIGSTQNVRGRMAQLCLPVHCVIGLLPDPGGLEGELHDRFHQSRIGRSEWFALTPDLEAFLATLVDPQLDPSLPSPSTPARFTPPDPETVAHIPNRLLHTTAEAAALLGIAEADAKQMIIDGDLPAVMLGRRSLRIRRSAIDDLTKPGGDRAG